jgi:hypothetical protein
VPELKLAKLPDRTPVKITISVIPELHYALQQYAVLYRTTYGEAETIAELVPFMLGIFLESDRGFVKARKNVSLDVGGGAGNRRGRRQWSARSPSPVGTDD